MRHAFEADADLEWRVGGADRRRLGADAAGGHLERRHGRVRLLVRDVRAGDEQREDDRVHRRKLGTRRSGREGKCAGAGWSTYHVEEDEEDVRVDGVGDDERDQGEAVESGYVENHEYELQRAGSPKTTYPIQRRRG